MNLVKTIIVDDERYACERLKKLLLPFPQILVSGLFSSSGEAFEYLKKHKPGLIFLDVELGNNESAFDLIDKIYAQVYHPHIILVTAHIHYTIKAIKHEVFDYLLKPVDVDELKGSLNRLLRHLSIKPEDVRMKFGMLSKREAQILGYVLDGKSSIEIAAILFISPNTVNTHRRNILKKTGSKSVLELIRKTSGK